VAWPEGVYLVGARVAGYNSAVFGLPANTSESTIVFFQATPGVVVATTKLSSLLTSRYGPLEHYEKLLQFLLRKLRLPAAALKTPLLATVRPKYGPSEPLPAGGPRAAARAAVAAAVAHLTRTSSMLITGNKAFAPTSNLTTLVRRCPVLKGWVQHNVSCVREGLGSNIDILGRQVGEAGSCAACGCKTPGMCANTRTDDNAQSAVGIGVAGALLNDARSVKIAQDIVKYVYFYSGARETPTNRSDASRGLIDWSVHEDPCCWFLK